jgi:hypothetical protein
MKEKTIENAIENTDSILTSGIEVITSEIKLHPVISGMAAFGLGFVAATIIFRISR